MTHQAEMELAGRAKDALKNPALTEAFARYQAKIVYELQQADPLNVALVLTLKRHLSSLAIVRKNLEIMVADGAEAEQKLNFERQSMAQRAKAAVRRIA